MAASPSAPSDLDPLRLSRWGSTWRYLVALGLAFVGLTVSASVPVSSSAEGGGTPQNVATIWLWVDIVAGVLGVVLIHFRRRFPKTVTTVVSLLTIVSLSASGPLCIVLVSLATRRRWREVVPIGLLAVVSGVAYERLVPGPDEASPWWLLVLVGVLSYGVCVATGFYIGARRELVSGLQERALTAERERASSENQARLTERSRIAREMHDVLAHRISLIAMHSGALVFRDDLTREEVVEAATVVRDSANLALAELRDVLGVLRDPVHADPDASAVMPPQPTLLLVDDLIAEHVRAGGLVALAVKPEVRQALSLLTATTSRTGYRVVQEALTNARKHAPGRPLTINISGSPGDQLVIAARNPMTGPHAALPSESGVGRMAPVWPASGMGLAGLHERISLAGGTLQVGEEPAGDFVLRAALPWRS